MPSRPRFAALALLAACGDAGTNATAGVTASETGATAPTTSTGEPSPTTTATGTSTSTVTSAGTGTGTGTGTDASTSTGGIKYDLGAPDPNTSTTDEATPGCTVVGDDAPIPCNDKAPPDSFEAEVQWSWIGLGGENNCGVTPLVGNFTDDNGDGAIDLCDKPDILVVVGSFMPSSAYMHIFDGETGTVHKRIDIPVSWATTPAIGDIDGDGLLEIVTTDTDGVLLAFEHDGTPKWTSTASVYYGNALGLADLDADGDVEIYGGLFIVDHDGGVVAVLDGDYETLYAAPTAADLDDDGDLEVVLGATAFHHDGSVYYDNEEIGPGYPQIADLDGDGRPEVLVSGANGFSVLEHDGATKPGYKDLRPTADPPGEYVWRRPATVHDFDGDGEPEFAQSSLAHYSVFEPMPVSVLWSATVEDESGIAAGTAFDFLGDGVAEAMYADETTFFAFDGAGKPLMTAPRWSGTMIEYPTVADVDNDGAAEVVVVSYSTYGVGLDQPCVKVLRDAQERWISARRIWNQHTYHVTNVREDGTIPQHESPHWKQLNTFRTQAQIAGNGGVCRPTPPG